MMKYLLQLLIILLSPLIAHSQSFSEGLLCVKIDGLYGYIDKAGNMVIEPQFKTASNFSEGLAAVMINDKTGFIDHSGSLVIQPIYDFTYGFIEDTAIVHIGERKRFITKLGEILVRPDPELELGVLTPFSEGLAKFMFYGGEYGFVDKQGQIIIDTVYTDAGNFNEGLASVKFNDRWGYINNTGRFVIPPLFIYAGDFYNSLAQVLNEDSKLCFINKNGETIISTEYRSIDKESENWPKFGIGDTYGLIIDDLSASLEKIGNQVREVFYDEFFGQPEKLEELVEEILDSLTYSSSVKVSINDITATFSDENIISFRVLLNVQNDYSNFYEGLAAFLDENDKFGFLDTDGNVAIQPVFDAAMPFSEGLALVKQDDTYGFIDRSGNMVITLNNNFDIAGGFKEGLAPVSLNNKWGFINMQGKIVIPIVFEL